MLIFHFSNIFVIQSALHYISFVHFLGIVGGPIFLMIVGISVVLSVNNRRNRGESTEKIRIHIIKRALIIFLLHFLLSASIFGLYTIWAWGILSLIGVSIIISYYLINCSAKKIWLIALGIFIASPFLRILLNYQLDVALFFDFYNFQAVSTYSTPWDIMAFIRSILVTPGFPVFPYIFFIVVGVWIGNSILKYKEKNDINLFLKKLIILGIIFTIVGFPLEILSNLFPLTPADKMVGNAGYNLWSQGIVFLTFVFFYWILDIKGGTIQLLNVFYFLGEISLTILFIHAFFGWYILPFLGGANNISLFSNFILSFTFYCGLWIINILWQKSKYKYSLQWIIENLS